MGIGAHWSPPTLNKYTILLLCSQPAHLLLHPVKRKKGNLEDCFFLILLFSLPGKISIEFHLCDAFYRPLATVWCKMDKLIKGIGWQTHKTYLYTLEPTHKDLLPSSSFESLVTKRDLKMVRLYKAMCLKAALIYRQRLKFEYLQT